MSSSYPAPTPILFYDPICPLCTRWVERLRRWKLLEVVEARPLDDAPGLGLPPERVDGLRSEILLWSPGSGEALSGYDGLVELLRLHGRAPRLLKIAAAASMRPIGRAAYKLVSLNRRILSPPATSGVACACDPPYLPAWRAALLAALVVGAAGGFFLHGMGLASYQPGRGALDVGWKSVRAAAVGWFVGTASGLIALPVRSSAFVWQALVVTCTGAAALAAAALVTAVLAVIGASPGLLAPFNILAVLASAGAMLLSMRRRAGNLGYPSWMDRLWAGTFLAGYVPFAITWDLLGLRLL
jgi:predicted DCC family thiol-disulfide oxidoreductase YuxK